MNEQELLVIDVVRMDVLSLVVFFFSVTSVEEPEIGVGKLSGDALFDAVIALGGASV